MNIRVRDIDVWCETRGSGMPVVTLHGWSPDHRIMKGCLEPVFRGRRFRRIYFDLPGMGGTRGSAWIDGSERMLDFVMEFIETIVPGEEYVLIGESYGGYLARGAIRRQPGRVRGLCLLCPIAKRETQRENAPPFQVLEKDESLQRMLNDEEKRYFESVNVRQTKRVWRRFKKEVLPGLRVADHAFLNDCLGRAVPFASDVDDLSVKHHFPTLMLAGRQDSSVGYPDLWKIVEKYPRASFVVLDKAGHNLQIEQPELFKALVGEWLDRIEAGTPPRGKQ